MRKLDKITKKCYTYARRNKKLDKINLFWKGSENEMGLIKKNFSTSKNNISRIILDGFSFNQLKINTDDLYEIISNMLLNSENMFFIVHKDFLVEHIKILKNMSKT